MTNKTTSASDLVERDGVIRFLEQAFRNIDLPELSRADLEDIAGALKAFQRPAADTITRLQAALKPLADSVLPEKDTIGGWRCGTNIPPSAAYHAHELLYGPNPHARSVGGE